MNTDLLNLAAIIQMRKDCLSGLTLTEIIRNLQSSLGPDGQSTFPIIRHFMNAFGLSLADARNLAACPILGGAAISADEADSMLRPKMLEYVRRSESDPSLESTR